MGSVDAKILEAKISSYFPFKISCETGFDVFTIIL
jgi:hypothetical protein